MREKCRENENREKKTESRIMEREIQPQKQESPSKNIKNFTKILSVSYS